MMRFFNQQQRFYCGIDLHARTLSLHVRDDQGHSLLATTFPASPGPLFDALALFRDGPVRACECMFAWCWVADLSQEQPIHGGKAKTDSIDAHKIVVLLRGGMLLQAYFYPGEMREARDLLRRRTFLVRKRAEARVHLTNTNSQYNLPPFLRRLAQAANRLDPELPAPFADRSFRRNGNWARK